VTTLGSENVTFQRSGHGFVSRILMFDPFYVSRGTTWVASGSRAESLRRLAAGFSLTSDWMASDTDLQSNARRQNPTFVVPENALKQSTMLRAYAAWTEGAVEADIQAIERAR